MIQAAGLLDYNFSKQQLDIMQEFLDAKRDDFNLIELARIFMISTFKPELNQLTGSLVAFLNNYFSKHIQTFDVESAVGHLSAFIEINLGLANCTSLQLNYFIWRNLIDRTLLSNIERLTISMKIVSLAALSLRYDVTDLNDNILQAENINLKSLSFFENYLLYYTGRHAGSKLPILDDLANNQSFIAQISKFEKATILSSYIDNVKVDNKLNAYCNILDEFFDMPYESDNVVKTPKGSLFYATLYLKDNGVMLCLMNDATNSSERTGLVMNLKAKLLSSEGLKFKVIGVTSFVDEEIVKHSVGEPSNLEELEAYRKETISRLLDLDQFN